MEVSFKNLGSRTSKKFYYNNIKVFVISCYAVIRYFILLFNFIQGFRDRIIDHKQISPCPHLPQNYDFSFSQATKSKISQINTYLEQNLLFLVHCPIPVSLFKTFITSEILPYRFLVAGLHYN